MSYEILNSAEGMSILHITKAALNSDTGWRIEFDDGKEATLYQQNGKWLQYDEQWLDGTTLRAIGLCIDNNLVKRNSGMAERYFYDMLIH